MNKYKIIFLDFDGVIVESNAIKEGAFRGLFDQFKEKEKEIFYYLDHNKIVDRRSKFKHIAQNIVKSTQAEELASRWYEEYALKTRQAVIDCAFVKGAESFLKYFSTKCPLILLSATIDEELQRIIQARNLSKYFKVVKGSPIFKDKEMLNVLLKFNLSATDAVFIGDSVTDQKFSESAKVDFIGRRGDSSFVDASFPVFDDLNGVYSYLQEKV